MDADQPLLVIMDGRFSSVGPGRLAGKGQMTGALRELLRRENVELLSRPIRRGDGEFIASVSPSLAVRTLPDWERAGVTRHGPSVAAALWRSRRRKQQILSVGPSVTQLLLLAMQAVRPRGVPVFLVRSHPISSLVLAPEASAPWMRASLRVYLWLYSALLRRVRGVRVCVSRALARDLALRDAFISPEVDWGELETLRAAGHHARAGTLFVGRLEPEKGPDVALEVFCSSRVAHQGPFVIVGVGSMEAELRLRAKNHSNIALVGRKDRNQLAELLRSAKYVVVPSRTEAFGLAALEAAVSGATVLHSGVGGLPEACAWWDGAVNLEGLDVPTWIDALAAAEPANVNAYLDGSLDDLRARMRWVELGDLV